MTFYLRIVYLVLMFISVIIFVYLDRKHHHFDIQLRIHRSDLIVYIFIIIFAFIDILLLTKVCQDLELVKKDSNPDSFPLQFQAFVLKSHYIVKSLIIVIFKRNEDILQTFSKLDITIKVSYVFYPRDDYLRTTSTVRGTLS